MKYLNSFDGSLTEGFFDFFKKTDEYTLKKRELLKIITDCCNKGLTFYNSRHDNQPMSTDVVRNRTKGPAYIIINDDLSVSFNGNVSWYRCDYEKLPFKFSKINGNFKLEQSYGLKSLEGLPNHVTGNLDISENGIESLHSLNVNFVGGTFNCSGNNLSTLEGLPLKIGGNIHAETNDICNYDGVSYENLKKLNLYMNPVNYVLFSFLKKSEDRYDLFKQYDPLRPPELPGKKPLLYQDRLNDYLKEFGKTMPYSDFLKHQYEII